MGRYGLVLVVFLISATTLMACRAAVKPPEPVLAFTSFIAALTRLEFTTVDEHLLSDEGILTLVGLDPHSDNQAAILAAILTSLSAVIDKVEEKAESAVIAVTVTAPNLPLIAAEIEEWEDGHTELMARLNSEHLPLLISELHVEMSLQGGRWLVVPDRFLLGAITGRWQYQHSEDGM